MSFNSVYFFLWNTINIMCDLIYDNYNRGWRNKISLFLNLWVDRYAYISHGMIYGATCPGNSSQLVMGDRESALTFTMHVAIVETDHVRITRVFIQWNLRIKDKLVYGPLSTIWRLSFWILSKRLLILYCIGNIVVYQ